MIMQMLYDLCISSYIIILHKSNLTVKRQNGERKLHGFEFIEELTYKYRVVAI